MSPPRSAAPALSVALIVMVVCLAPRPAAAQDVDQLIATGDKHLASYQFVQALEQFTAIPESATPPQLLEKYTGLAMALMGQGRYTGVGEHVDRAMALAAQIGTDSAIVSAENVRGQYEGHMKIGDRGLAAFQRAADLASRAGQSKSLAAVYGNLSTAYQGLEDWERSAYFAQKEYDLDPKPSPARSFSYRASRGIAFFELYDRDAAEIEFKAALELSALTKRPRDRSFAIGELAFLYWTFDRDADRALALYDEAIELAVTAKVTPLAANWLTNRANIYRDTGDYAKAEEGYRESVRMLDAGGLSRQTFHMWKNIGQTMRLTGRTKESAALLIKLIDERTPEASARHLWQAHMELASALATLGDREGARRHFETMLSLLEEQRKTAILDSFRTGTFAHALSAYDPYERYIRFLLEEGEARAIDALAVAERARARSFLEALASVRGAVAAKLPAPLLAEESRIGRAISAAQERLRSPSLDQVQRQAALTELSQAENAREQFLLAMRVEHPALAEARYPTLLHASEIQQSLRAGETALVFFLAEPASIRWIVTRERIRHGLLPGRSAIERDADRVRQLLRAPADAAATRAATTQLSRALFDGVDLDGDRPLVVVPHGVLHYIPFEALPVGNRLLIEQRPVSYAPSLNALVQLRRAPANTTAFRVLAVGNPALAAAASSGSERAGDVENLALLGPLPFAERELHAIGRTFPDRTRILSGASARESDLRAPELSRFPVIHFATHGLVSDAQPKRSGLLMAPERGEDGLLQMDEIYGLGLKANLIVLSACQTAIGREITGEGLVGISRAFFYAGARSVVATLWNLNDRFAAEFVERFYRELKIGVPAEDALRAAKIAYVNDPRYSHPFYWSSLVMLGDGTQALVAERVPEPRLQFGIALAFGVLAVAITARKLTKI
jgi:CHAT domain-containing protein